MISKCYKIANKVVEINSLYEDVHNYCSEYMTDESPDYTIIITQSDIDNERIKSEKEQKSNNETIINFHDSYLEELAVYRKIAEKMIDYDTILFHGSAIAVDGVAYLFTAKSGTGKSTHTKLWCRYFGKKATMINDDKPLICISDDIIIYGTPYNGKHRLSKNTAVPLKAICILARSLENHIEKISKDKAYAMLVQQVYRSEDIDKIQKTLELIDNLLDKVNLYLLGCNMDIEAAKVAYEGMK